MTETQEQQSTHLSARENEVVVLALQGKSHAEMAAALFLSKSGVKYHLTNIYRKCQVANKTQLILKFAARGAA